MSFETSAKLAFVSLRHGIAIHTFETMEEILETIMHMYAMDTDLKTMEKKAMDIISSIKEEEREEAFQAETGRCYHCGKPMDDCDCA